MDLAGSAFITLTLALIALGLGGQSWEASGSFLLHGEYWDVGWVPPDGTGPENKVTFSAQTAGLPPRSWLWGHVCGQPVFSGTYSDHIVPGHSQEGLRPFSLCLHPWFMELNLVWAVRRSREEINIKASFCIRAFSPSPLPRHLPGFSLM